MTEAGAQGPACITLRGDEGDIAEHQYQDADRGFSPDETRP